MRKLMVLVAAAALGIASIATATAAQPPGQLGGGGSQHNGNGGYEGQPGNQSNG